jgi:hypothetical protein
MSQRPEDIFISSTKLRPKLTRTDDEIRAKLGWLHTRADVADLLEVPYGFLKWLLYVNRERQHYRSFDIVKRDGTFRRITAPPKNLLILQQKVLHALTLIYRPKACVCGFVAGRSIRDNAQHHTRRRWTVSFDLQDFFPSIHLGRVRGMLMGVPYNFGYDAAETIAQIACTHDGKLPQGGATSPILANMVCAPFDSSMLDFARANKCRYSRYADDITLSGTSSLPPKSVASLVDNAWVVGEDLTNLIGANSFLVNHSKTRVRESKRRQRITGVVVNDFCNAPRPYIKTLRSLVHACESKGALTAGLEHAAKRKRPLPPDPAAWMIRVLRGRLAYYSMLRGVDDPCVRHMARRIAALAPSVGKPNPRYTPLETLAAQPLSRRSKREPRWQLWFEKFSKSIVYLRSTSLKTGQVGLATGFYATATVCATAGHNCFDADGDERKLEVIGDDGVGTVVDASDIWGQNKESTGLDVALFKAPSTCELPVFTQERIPMVGEPVAAIGFPTIAFRDPGAVLHIGYVESVARHWSGVRYISVSFPSGPGLSGAPLIDAEGHCVGIMVNNGYLPVQTRSGPSTDEPSSKAAGGVEHAVAMSSAVKVEAPSPAFVRPYGQAICIEHWRALSSAPRIRV